ncbi:MAG: hypothetical protein V2J55_17330 [Candidatus Competibacteraceae bacterium]|nr:hypothetical protein [Candidatus Competibacteraceae bacterium]
MITSIYQLINNAVVFFILLLGVFGVSQAADIAIESIALHAKLAEDSPDFKELGGYPQLKRYSLHATLAPKQLDVVVHTKGTGVTTLVVDIAPVVGMTDWDNTEGITDMALLEKTKTTFPSVLRYTQAVTLKGDSRFTVTDVPIETIVKQFTAVKLWPRNLVFRVGLLPIAGESMLSNNVAQYELVMDPPD